MPVSFIRLLAAPHVLAEWPRSQSCTTTCIEHPRPNASGGAENVTVGGEPREPLAKPWHEILQCRVPSIVCADKPAQDGVRTHPKPLRVSFVAQAGALGRVAVRPGVGWVERDAELAGQIGLQPFDVRYRLQDELIINADSQHREVFGEGVGNVRLTVAFNIANVIAGTRAFFR